MISTNYIILIMVIILLVNTIIYGILLLSMRELKTSKYMMDVIRKDTENAINSINHRVCNEPYAKGIDDCLDYLKSITKYNKNEIVKMSNEDLIADMIKTFKQYKDNYTHKRII